MTLTEFLLERISAWEDFWRTASSGDTLGEGLIRTMLAECEAKRRIVELHPLVSDPDRLVAVWTGPTPGVACETCGGNPADSKSLLEDIGPCETLLALATIYADHPDCQEEWKP